MKVQKKVVQLLIAVVALVAAWPALAEITAQDVSRLSSNLTKAVNASYAGDPAAAAQAAAVIAEADALLLQNPTPGGWRDLCEMTVVEACVVSSENAAVNAVTRTMATANDASFGRMVRVRAAAVACEVLFRQKEYERGLDAVNAMPKKFRPLQWRSGK